MPLNLSGQLALLRVHDRGTKYGPPSDQIDVEVVVQFVGRPADAFGFRLRADADGPARDGMLGLLRDGFNHGWTVHIDYNIKPGKRNGTIMRVWLTRPPSIVIHAGGVLEGTVRARRPAAARKGTKRPAAKRRPRR